MSDDSDIEVHPNVDKKSFIRAKQGQIHQERAQRKHQIETFRYEKLINDGLIKRIDALLERLRAHAVEAARSDANSDQLVFQSLIESTGDPLHDQPPSRPKDVHANVAEQPSYSKMMATLVDQVKQAVDEKKPESSQRMDLFIQEVQGHHDKVADLQSQLLQHLAELEKEEGAKITSEGLKFGFNSSHIAKAASTAAVSSTGSGQDSSVELLNPGAAKAAAGSIPEAVDNDPDFGDDRHIKPSALGRRFAKLPIGDYRAYLEFITKNSSVLQDEKETDGLLIDAYDKLVAGKPEFARQCVHQARLLQYCRGLGGAEGVSLFFKRITSQDHRARKMFFDDVNETFAKLRESARAQLQEAAAEDNGEREQIQLQPVNPGQTIGIHVPRRDDPAEAEARKIFSSFPVNLQKALETGSLDEVNKVIGAMKVTEAEQIVELLSEGGMLSMEEGVIDTTTEEGRQMIAEIERMQRECQGGPQLETLEELETEEKRAVDELD